MKDYTNAIRAAQETLQMAEEINTLRAEIHHLEKELEYYRNYALDSMKFMQETPLKMITHAITVIGKKNNE